MDTSTKSFPVIKVLLKGNTETIIRVLHQSVQNRAANRCNTLVKYNTCTLHSSNPREASKKYFWEFVFNGNNLVQMI